MASPIVTFTWTKDGDQAHGPINVTIAGGGGGDNVDNITLVTGTNVIVNNAIDTSQLKALYIHSTTDATIYANDTSGGSPSFHLTLTGGTPLVWVFGSGITNPITADVTKWYVTNAADTVLNIRTDQDPTP